MATTGEESEGRHRALHDLVAVTALAAAAALAVAVVVTPAASYLDRSLSGLTSDIPASVSAPVKRLVTSGDIKVRVRPGRPAPSLALADSDVSPGELVTGQPAGGRPGKALAIGGGVAVARSAAVAGRAAGVTRVAGPTAPVLPAPEAPPPPVASDIEFALAPAPALPGAPVVAAEPADAGDAGPAVKPPTRPSRSLRDATDATVVSIAGTKTWSGSKKGSRRAVQSGGISLASLSGGGERNRSKSNDDKSSDDKSSDDKSNDDKSNDKHQREQSHDPDDETKKRDPKPQGK